VLAGNRAIFDGRFLNLTRCGSSFFFQLDLIAHVLAVIDSLLREYDAKSCRPIRVGMCPGFIGRLIRCWVKVMARLDDHTSARAFRPRVATYTGLSI